MARLLVVFLLCSCAGPRFTQRAKERPTVSTPVTWEEVDATSRARRGTKRLTFEYSDVLDRVERDGDLFAPVLTLRQHLPQLGA